MKTYIVTTTWASILVSVWLHAFGFGNTIWIAWVGLIVLLLIFLYNAGTQSIDEYQKSKVGGKRTVVTHTHDNDKDQVIH